LRRILLGSEIAPHLNKLLLDNVISLENLKSIYDAKLYSIQMKESDVEREERLKIELLNSEKIIQYNSKEEDKVRKINERSEMKLTTQIQKKTNNKRD